MKYLPVNIFCIFICILAGNFKMYGQHDADSLRNVMEVWHLEKDFIKKKSGFNDSTLDMFHISKAEEKYSILNSSLGNIGSASISDCFFKRIERFDQDFLFNEPYFLYLKNSQNISYFNSRRPYTSIMHTTSSKLRDLQTIDFIHTQNVTPYFNFGVDYDFITSLGFTEDEKGNQATKINSVSITSNFKKDKYFAYISYIYNKINNTNSGGYVDTLEEVQELPSSLISSGANIDLQNQELTYTHGYKFGNYKNLSYQDTIIKVLEPKFNLSHSFSIKRRYRVYTDNENETGDYYPINHYQPDATMDSVGMRILSNKIMFGSEEVFENEKNFGFSLIYEFKLAEIFNFKRYFYLDNSTKYFENNLRGDIHISVLRKMPIHIGGDYRLTGYRGGDARLELYIQRFFSEKFPSSHLSLKTDLIFQSPDLFMRDYYSNHYIWENNLNTEQRIRTNFALKMPEFKLTISAHNAMINNFVYFYSEDGSDLNVRQKESLLNVSSVSAEKVFTLKNIAFSNKVIWQNSSDENVLSLPLIAFYQSTYFILRLAGDVIFHFGADVYYSTPYKIISFNPAVGQFYFENDESALAGNYPFTSVFADIKIKKNVMLYFRYSNLASFFDTYTLHRDVNRYLIYGTSFNFGVRWTFKN